MHPQKLIQLFDNNDVSSEVVQLWTGAGGTDPEQEAREALLDYRRRKKGFVTVCVIAVLLYFGLALYVEHVLEKDFFLLPVIFIGGFFLSMYFVPKVQITPFGRAIEELAQALRMREEDLLVMKGGVLKSNCEALLTLNAADVIILEFLGESDRFRDLQRGPEHNARAKAFAKRHDLLKQFGFKDAARSYYDRASSIIGLSATRA